MLEFNEKNVRNVIINVKNVRELGERLKIPPHLLDDMEKHPPEHQKLKLVEIWFQVDVNCNWKSLENAMRAPKWEPGLEFTLPNALTFIQEVTNWKDLGLQLGLKPPQINSCDDKQKLIMQWMKIDPEASWENLQAALESPTMCENRVSQGIARRRGSSFDRSSLLSSTTSGLHLVCKYIIITFFTLSLFHRYACFAV